jgi:hypothetical protein
LKGQELSFTEIAKVVGERWQVLPAEEREACERQANSAKERYYAELAEYKKTAQYDAYQRYLEDFKAKHAVPTKGQYHRYTHATGTKLTGLEGKRSKLETETSTSTRSSSHDQNERVANKRLSSVQPDVPGHMRSEASPPMGPARLPAGPSFPSKPTSPASHPLSTLNSPRMGDHYSPISASPRSALFDASIINPTRDPRALPDTPFPYHPSYAHPPLQPPVTTPPSYPAVSQYHNPSDHQSRRPIRDANRLPPLSHEDTTYSSESGHSGSGYNSAATGFPGGLLPLDASKTMRILPQPIPTIGPSASPLDRPSQAMATQSSPPAPDYRTQGPLAALVRAGQLAARIVDDEAMDAENSS